MDHKREDQTPPQARIKGVGRQQQQYHRLKKQTSLNTYLDNQNYNKIRNTVPLKIHHSETILCRTSLAQLRTNKCPTLHSYLNKIDEKHSLPLYCICKTEPHTIIHLFHCIKINTHLNVTDLWMDPVEGVC